MTRGSDFGRLRHPGDSVLLSVDERNAGGHGRPREGPGVRLGRAPRFRAGGGATNGWRHHLGSWPQPWCRLGDCVRPRRARRRSKATFRPHAGHAKVRRLVPRSKGSIVASHMVCSERRRFRVTTVNVQTPAPRS